MQRLEVLLEEAVIDDVCSKFGCSASDVVDAVPPPYPRPTPAVPFYPFCREIRCRARLQQTKQQSLAGAASVRQRLLYYLQHPSMRSTPSTPHAPRAHSSVLVVCAALPAGWGTR